MPPQPAVKPPSPPPVDESISPRQPKTLPSLQQLKNLPRQCPPQNLSGVNQLHKSGLVNLPKTFEECSHLLIGEKIRDTRTALARGSNFPYAIVYFTTVEEATSAIQTLDHPKLKFGDDLRWASPFWWELRASWWRIV